MYTKVAEEVMVVSVKEVYYNITRAIVCKPILPQAMYKYTIRFTYKTKH